MESKHAKINLNDGKLEFSLGKSKNTDFFMKYRPIIDHFQPFFSKNLYYRWKLFIQTELSSLVEAIIWDRQSKMQEKVTCEMELLLSQPSRKSNPNKNLGLDGPHNWS